MGLVRRDIARKRVEVGEEVIKLFSTHVGDDHLVRTEETRADASEDERDTAEERIHGADAQEDRVDGGDVHMETPHPQALEAEDDGEGSPEEQMEEVTEQPTHQLQEKKTGGGDSTSNSGSSR